MGCSVRLVGPGGVYRCHLLRKERDGLVFSAPLQRDHFVPLRVEEKLMVQMPVVDGLVTFRSEIMSRDAEEHSIKLETPKRFRHVDRRSEPRDDRVCGREVSLNGSAAALVNLSAGGARVVTPLALKPGERIQVQLGMEAAVCFGWALESIADHLGVEPARSVRVRFEAPLSGLVIR